MNEIDYSKNMNLLYHQRKNIVLVLMSNVDAFIASVNHIHLFVIFIARL